MGLWLACPRVCSRASRARARAAISVSVGLSMCRVSVPLILLYRLCQLVAMPPMMPPTALPSPSDVPRVSASSPSPMSAPAAAPLLVRMP